MVWPNYHEQASLAAGIISPMPAKEDPPFASPQWNKKPQLISNASAGDLSATRHAYGKLPLSFEANEGQTDAQVKFLARGAGYGLFLTPTGVALSLNETAHQLFAQATSSLNPVQTPSRGVALSMTLEHADLSAHIEATDELPGKVNYFIDNETRKWRRNIRTYSKVRYRNVYHGVDAIYYGNQQQLEYDFVVAPGANARGIKLAFKGANAIREDVSGDLLISTAAGEIRQRKPLAYQEFKGERQEVEARYHVTGDSVSFELGRYDRTRSLVIDPVLIYSSFLGGTSSEDGLGIAVDAQGSAYLTGSTASTDFPLDSADFPLDSAFQSVKDTVTDAFVVKLNPAGTALVYSTYLGGNGSDTGNAIAVDDQGSAYVAGLTGSGSFPTTPGVFQNQKSGLIDGFLTKLNPSGSALVYSTFLGGDNSDTVFGLAVDTAGRAYAVGRTDSTRLNFLPLQRHGSPAYKSTAGAGHWSASAAELTGSTVNTFALDPATSNTIYAGSNVGVFKSTDGGTHWNLTGTSNSGTAPVFTSTIVVDPSNSSVIYAGTQSSGVYKSTNGGPLYAQKNSGIQPGGFSINALALDPSSPSTVYAGTSFGIYKSTNGGDTWAEIKNGISGSSPRVNEVVIDPNNPATVYIGTNRGMFKTTNGGALWTVINAGPLSNPFTPEITALAIDPTNSSILYASGPGVTDLIFKTTDGGATWTGGNSTGITFTVGTQSFAPNVNTLAIDPATPATLYAATSGGAIYKSTNGAANWSQSNTGITNANANGVTVDPHNPATVYAGTTIGNDAFIVRLNSSGSAPEYFLNFGGDESDEARGVALDSDGNAYVVGSTSSTNFPVLNGVQSTLGGSSDAFVVKLNPAGSALVYSTYLGGSNSEQGRAIAVRAGSGYVTGLTTSQDFPLVNSFKSTLATFDTDAFVSKLSSSGSSLDFSSYLGGSGTDQGLGIAVDPSGGVYVTGVTISSDFPTLAAPQPGLSAGNDAFVTKLNSTGTAIVYSTYLGGIGADQGNAIAVDALGNAYVIGTTASVDFPTVKPFQPTLKGTDAFVVKLGVQADMTISESDSRDPVMVNNLLTYTLKVSNAGPSPVTGVKVTDVLPGSLTFGSAISTLGTCSFNSGTVTCDIGNMPVAGVVTITLTVTPTTVATISNTATVSANEPDDNSANNSATESTKVSASPSINGRVTDTVGAAVSGVLMTLSGTQGASVLTDSNGFYQFAELAGGGNYSVVPTKNNLSFEPPSRTFNSLGADQIANFVASTCTYAIAPTLQSFGAAGGSGSVNVTSLHDCPWTAVSSVDWITITSGSSGVGSGTVNFSVSATTAPRAGHITIAGQNFAVYQEFNSCGTPAFSVATYSLPSNATVIRTADLNGDGHNDLVAENAGIDSGGGIPISILLNNGAGGFITNVVDSGFGGIAGFVLADFNGDHRPEIAVTNSFSPFVRIFSNDGNGGFGSHVDVVFGAGNQLSGHQIFTADLNHDGNPDLLIAMTNQPSNPVQILLGNGNGGFAQSATFVPLQFSLIDVADFNNDCNPDLLLAAGQSSSPIGVMLGNGSGGFGSTILSGGIDFASVAGIGDFDGDGNLDLVIPTTITTFSPPSSFTGLAVMAGDGAGHFTVKTRFSGASASQLTVADLNADGKADVAFTRGGSKVTIAFGDGSGGLANPIDIDTGASDETGGNFGVTTADLAGDAKPDIAVADYTRGASVLRNNCAAAASISGHVTDSRSGGKAGMTLTLSGAQSASTQTDSGGNYFFGNLTPGGNYVVTPSRDNFRFIPINISINGLSGNQTADFVGTPITLQFTTQDYVVDENAGSIQISVRRSGDLSGVTTVDYATVDGTASARTDYTAAFGKLQFNPGESLKSFTILIANDNLVEGFESLTVSLSNPVGAIFNNGPMEGPPNTSLVEIRDNDSGSPSSNPLDDTQFFVLQHYSDFLNRLPDPSGFNFWTGQINQCGSDPVCLRAKRIDVSNAFFYELEYQQTGAYVYRLYRAAFGNTQPFPNPNPDPSHPGEEKKLLAYQVFGPDRARVVGGSDLAQSQLDLVNAFVLRPEFVNKYPTNLDGPSFVDAVVATIKNEIGADLGSQRAALISLFNSGGRGAVLYRLADDNAQTNPIDNRAFIDAEYNRAFVATQYFGYLRRDPDMPGFLFWLGQVSSAPLRDVSKQHAMVCSFITSGEYQLRFSNVISHVNGECPQ
jgi:uncharacterized repeat protein (TIGR01451 family)